MPTWPWTKPKKTGWGMPLLVTAIQFVIPGAGYLVLEDYVRLAVALPFLLLPLFIAHPAVFVIPAALWVDVFFRARAHGPPYFGPRRNLQATLVGAAAIALFAGVTGVVILRPAIIGRTENGCNVVFALHPAVRAKCLREAGPRHATMRFGAKAAPVQKTAVRHDGECELYLADSGVSAASRPTFRDLCYLMRAVMSDDAAYCGAINGAQARCYAFLAATDGRAAVCDAESGDDRAACQAAASDPAARQKVYDQMGTMDCASEGFKDQDYQRCLSVFAGYFADVKAAYERAKGAQ